MITAIVFNLSGIEPCRQFWLYVLTSEISATTLHLVDAKIYVN